MGVVGPGERATVCREGCAMTSASMALRALGARINGTEPVTPGSLNAFLVRNQLYECIAGDCNNLVLAAPEAVSVRMVFVSETQKPPAARIRDGLVSGEEIYLAHVQNRTHFVLLTGYAPDLASFAVNDPFYNRTAYRYDEIADMIIYRVGNGSTVIEPRRYPLFMQCDPRWGARVMEVKTLCEVGCLMSCVSMALRGTNISVGGEEANPGTLNEWLRTHNGYEAGDDLREEAVPLIDPRRIRWPADGMHRTNDLSVDAVRSYLIHGRTVMANVMGGRHFVLVTGWGEGRDALRVHDPGFRREWYSHSADIVGWRVFDMSSR